ncbi:MAG: manganese efflux pump, partial [Clostridia bacterium]|nr:manganese efflux pump [Clostridia bacterium]
MSIFTLIILALGLAMDSFAVSVSDGMSGKCCRLCNVFALSLTFGAFQAAMPIIGYFAGSLFSEAIAAFDHWIALA